MAQYNSKYTGPQIDAAVERALAGGDIDKALEQKAPDGYGLGGNPTIALRTHNDVDNAKKIGWYTFYGYENGTNWYIFGCIGGTIFVTTARNGFAQFLFPDGDPFIARRYYVPNSGWEPWELFNPPMKAGIEYRTTKRYMEKPVYAKLVNFGAMPNTAAKTLAHGIADVQYVVSLSGDGNWSNLIGYRYVDYAYADSTNIYIKSNADLSTMYAHVVLEYTKSTD